MRDFRFRAFDGERMRYDVTGFEHGQDNEMTAVFIDGDFYLINGCDHSPASLVGNRTADVTQYTGLKDKNGKEIYEGDIVVSEQLDDTIGLDNWNRHDQGCAVVEMSTTRGVRFEGQRYTGAWDWDNEDTIHSIQFYVVIGNIYENKELLGK